MHGTRYFIVVVTKEPHFKIRLEGAVCESVDSEMLDLRYSNGESGM